jgi:hypothetical protein
MLSLFRRAMAFVASSVADAESHPDEDDTDEEAQSDREAEEEEEEATTRHEVQQVPMDETRDEMRTLPMESRFMCDAPNQRPAEVEMESDQDDESLPILQLPTVADAQMASARAQCEAWRLDPAATAPEQVSGPPFDACSPGVSVMALGTLGVLQRGQARLMQHVPVAVLALRRCARPAHSPSERPPTHRVELVWRNRLLLSLELTSSVPFEFFPREHGMSWITPTGPDTTSAFYFRFQHPSEEQAVRVAWSLACFESARAIPLAVASKPSSLSADASWIARAHERTQASATAGGTADTARSERLESVGVVSTRSATEALSDDDEPSSASSDEEEGQHEQRAARLASSSSSSSRRQGHQRRHNEHLAVTHSGERAFVTRDAQLGVFRHDSTGRLENTHFLPAIETTAGVTVVPKQMLLHMEDSRMLFLSEHDPTRVVEFDIECGKVVQEYGKSEDFHLGRLAPVSKFAGSTGEGMIAAVNANHVLLLDGRQNGHNKLAVQTEYQSAQGFSCLATTATGSIVTGSTTGVVRLFDEVGKRAKTALPGLGDGILGIDVSADGRWILATAKSYLLLIPTETSGSSDAETVNGFKQSITSSSASPIKLQLDPRDVVQHNIQAVSFRVAHFSTGDHANAENWIVTSTGPYLITWNFRSVIRRKRYFDYTIKDCNDAVVENQFVYNHDDTLIVTLPDNLFAAKRTNKEVASDTIASSSTAASQ